MWYLAAPIEGAFAGQIDGFLQRGPLQHGATDMGYRLRERTIRLVIGIDAPNRASFWNMRSTLSRLFAPDAQLKLMVTYEDGRKRVLDVVRRDQPREGDIQAFQQEIAFSLVAPDPTWYDPSMVFVAYGVGGSGSTGLTFPAAFPWTFGASTIDATRSIQNRGEWLSYPVIELTGPLTSPVIRNLTTGEKLDFTGLNLATGERIIVDCRYGQKTVVDGTGANRITALSTDSDLATFHLEAHPRAVDGVNVIRVTASNATTASEIYIRFYERYLGV